MKQFLLVDVEGNYTLDLPDGSGVTRVCDAAALAGDLVCDSETVTNGVDVITDNVDLNSGVSGIIVEKLTSTTCIVANRVTLKGLSMTLVKGGKVYLSGTGKFTAERPTSGYTVILGHAIDTDAINFNPVNTMIAIMQGYDTQAEALLNPVDLDVSSLTTDGSSLTAPYLLG